MCLTKTVCAFICKFPEEHPEITVSLLVIGSFFSLEEEHRMMPNQSDNSNGTDSANLT